MNACIYAIQLMFDVLVDIFNADEACKSETSPVNIESISLMSKKSDDNQVCLSNRA